jgi:acyl-coenzyme A thioesterase PaaI-like protein
MSQGSQLGAKTTIAPAQKPHSMLRDFYEHGPGPMRRAGALARELKGELLEVDAEAGTSLCAFSPNERFVQGAGVIQGGVVSAMLDYGLVMAAFGRLAAGKSFGTVSMTTNFLKPVAPGRYLVRARLDRMGSRMVFASAELLREGAEGALATASAVMAITDP